MEQLTAEQIKRLVAEWINEALDTEERTLATRGHTFRFRDERWKNISAVLHAEAYSGIAYDRTEQLVSSKLGAIMQNLVIHFDERVKIPF